MPPFVDPSILALAVGPPFSNEFPQGDALASFRSNFRAPETAGMLSYWLAKCPSGGIPRRREMEPAEMKPFLPYLAIWEWSPETNIVQIRLGGTGLSEWLGRDPSNRAMTEVLPESWCALLDPSRPPLVEKRPVWLVVNLAPFGREHVTVELLALPLLRNEGTPGLAIGLFARLPAGA